MVRLDVRDAGSGMAHAARPGVGLVSMETRARELGGRLLVQSGDAGTTVTAYLPGAAP